MEIPFESATAPATNSGGKVPVANAFTKDPRQFQNPKMEVPGT
jgi:hypothetical protein